MCSTTIILTNCRIWVCKLCASLMWLGPHNPTKNTFRFKYVGSNGTIPQKEPHQRQIAAGVWILRKYIRQEGSENNPPTPNTHYPVRFSFILSSPHSPLFTFSLHSSVSPSFLSTVSTHLCPPPPIVLAAAKCLVWDNITVGNSASVARLLSFLPRANNNVRPS